MVRSRPWKLSAFPVVLVFVATLALPTLALPGIAHASPGDTSIVSTRTETVSGLDIAGEILHDLSRLDVDSNGATVTLDVAGAPHEIGLDIADLQGGLVTGEGVGLAGLAVISALAVGLLRVAAVLVHLFT